MQRLRARLISDWQYRLTSRMTEAQENHKDNGSLRLSYSLALLLLLIRDKTGDMVFGYMPARDR